MLFINVRKYNAALLDACSTSKLGLKVLQLQLFKNIAICPAETFSFRDASPHTAFIAASPPMRLTILASSALALSLQQ
jgi:hypothetical protein